MRLTQEQAEALAKALNKSDTVGASVDAYFDKDEWIVAFMQSGVNFGFFPPEAESTWRRDVDACTGLFARALATYDPSLVAVIMSKPPEKWLDLLAEGLIEKGRGA
jgi:hypothetical protein